MILVATIFILEPSTMPELLVRNLCVLEKEPRELA
jgi:hypothetical protein